MHLVYLDDSADEADFQIIGAVIVPDEKFFSIEEYLAYTIDRLVPEEIRDQFEFHASAMYNGKPPFDKLTRDQALAIFSRCASIIAGAPIPVVYGAVDLRKLRRGLYATAQPIDVAFRLCIQGVEQWFEQAEGGGLGVLICDKGKKGVEESLQKAFRAYRRRLKSEKYDRGLLRHIHDDMYFGDSAYSVGIQLADIASYFILGHLQRRENTEFLYEQIKEQIFFGRMEPDSQPSRLGPR